MGLEKNLSFPFFFLHLGSKRGKKNLARGRGAMDGPVGVGWGGVEWGGSHHLCISDSSAAGYMRMGT